MVSLGRRLSRTKAHRDAMMRTLASQLISLGTVRTTLAKCRELGGRVERVIANAKANAGEQGERPRYAQSKLNSGAFNRLLELLPQFRGRSGGYTRIQRLEPRVNDRAPLALIELVDTPVVAPDGHLQRGNMKLWLLVKSTIHDEHCQQQYSPQTLLNLRRMRDARGAAALRRDMEAIRSALNEPLDSLDALFRQLDGAARPKVPRIQRTPRPIASPAQSNVSSPL